MLVLLRSHNIRLLLLARLVDTAGNSALWIALSIHVKELTGSNSQTGFIIFSQALGMLMSPLASSIIDRIRRRPLLVALNLLSVAIIVPLLLIRGPGSVWLAYPIMTLYGFSAGLTGATHVALMQRMVPAQKLADANGLLQTLLQGLRIVTPLIGAGAVSSVGIEPLILGDAATFLVAGGLIAFIGAPETMEAPETDTRKRRISAGYRHIFSTDILRRLTLSVVVAIIGFGFSETILFAVVDEGLHRPPAFLGILTTVEGVGAVMAGLMAAMLMRRIGEVRTVAVGLGCSTVGYLLSTLPFLPAVLPGVFLVGLSLSWILSGVNTCFQQRTPASLMGRTDAALGFIVSTPQTAAIAGGATLIAILDYRVILASISGLLAISATMLLVRPVRSAHPLPSIDTGQLAAQPASTATEKVRTEPPNGKPSRNPQQPS